METVIGLLFVLLPIILKLIGKKLEQSGESQKAEKVRNLARKLDVDEDDPFSDWMDSQVPEPEPEPELAPKVEYVPVAPKITVVEPVIAENVVRQTTSPKPKTPPRKKNPILAEEKKAPKDTKIDPKKLVIYSEIMKPKYKD